MHDRLIRFAQDGIKPIQAGDFKFIVLSACDVTDDHDGAVVPARDQSHLEIGQLAVVWQRILECNDSMFSGNRLQRLIERLAHGPVRKVLDAHAAQFAWRDHEVGLRAGLDREDGPRPVHAEEQIRDRLEHGAQFGIGLEQLLRTLFEGAFQHCPVSVELPVGLVHPLK